jgi:hypothetical protein
MMIGESGVEKEKGEEKSDPGGKLFVINKNILANHQMLLPKLRLGMRGMVK